MTRVQGTQSNEPRRAAPAIVALLFVATVAVTGCEGLLGIESVDVAQTAPESIGGTSGNGGSHANGGQGNTSGSSGRGGASAVGGIGGNSGASGVTGGAPNAGGGGFAGAGATSGHSGASGGVAGNGAGGSTAGMGALGGAGGSTAGMGGLGGAGGSIGGASGGGGMSASGGAAGSLCGNGVVDAGEDCETSLGVGAATCEDVVHAPATGSLSCGANCHFDTKNCVWCGNGVVEQGESCDGADLGTPPGTCADVTPSSMGTVVCSPYCELDTSGCSVTADTGDLGGLAADSPWPMMMRGPSHAGRTVVSGPSSLTPKWQYQTGISENVTSPVIGGDGTLYVGTHDGEVFAIHADGSFGWSVTVGGNIDSIFAIAKDGSLIVSSDASVLSLDTSMKGKTNWKVVTGGNVSSPTIGADGTIYVGSQDGNLWTISPSGKPGWKASIGVGGDPEAWAPAVAPDGSIYIDEFAPLVQSLHLYAFTATGAPKWGPISVPPVYNHSPVVGGDGTVYLGSGGGLCAYSPDTGEQLWCALADSVVNDPSIGADGTLYVGVDHELAAIAPDGSVLWKKPGLPSPDGVGSPIVGGDGLLYGTAWGAGGGLYLMMPTGALLATDPIGTGAFSIPALGADGTLYAFGYDGSLYAFEAP